MSHPAFALTSVPVIQLRDPPMLGDDGVLDLRGRPVLALFEAACRDGVAFLATVTTRDGSLRDALGGHPNQEQLTLFFVWSRGLGVVADVPLVRVLSSDSDTDVYLRHQAAERLYWSLIISGRTLEDATNIVADHYS